MINYPIAFHRDYRYDCTPSSQQGFSKIATRVAHATLPLLGLHPTLRGPLSLGMSGARSVMHMGQMVESIKNKKFEEGGLHFLHGCLATAGVGLYFFNKTYSILASSVSDLINNTRNKDWSHAALDILFIASICHGTLALTCACVLFQVAHDCYASREHFQKGEYLEGVCQALLAGGHLHQAVPQLRALHWSWKYRPLLSAELKQDSRGFVYLDIPDEQLHSLINALGDKKAQLPPYFGKGMAGAHVSVIRSDEMQRKGMPKIQDLGKKFAFRIVQTADVCPDDWKAKVHILTLDCPELESMRKKHGFSPRIGDHDFHLTYALTPL